MSDLKEELKEFPASPEVYPMHSDRDEIIYIGKAINLKNGVHQYFQSNRNKTTKIEQMVSHVAQFEHILTGLELEALVLECNLTKEHRPRHNTMLKDDKSYPYIRATTGKDYPHLLLARDMEKDSRGKYFGPYTSTGAVKDTLDLIHKLYHIHTCNRSLPKGIGKNGPCLNHRIRQCDTPCQGYISRKDYQANSSLALDFLNGKYDPLIKTLGKKMQNASEDLGFERTIEYGELLSSVKQVAQKQEVISSSMKNRDIVAMAKDEKDTVVQVLFIREGKLIGRNHFHVPTTMAESEEEILGSFVKQFYTGTPFIPRELWLQHPLADEEAVSQWLAAKRGQKVRIVVPKEGEKERLVGPATKNTEFVLSQDKERIKREELCTTGAMNRTGELIGIGGIRRMETFSIPNTNRVESVGSMVVYEDGKPKRSDYGKSRIKTAQESNDYASMEEVLAKHSSHGMREIRGPEDKGGDLSMGSFTRFPDLTMVGDGRGQVNIALKVLDELGLFILTCGMVKDDNRRIRGLCSNDIEISINRYSEGFHLTARIQDGAHRLTAGYHRSLRGKGQVRFILDDIPGIGPVRRKALIYHLKDVESVYEAGMEGLERASRMSRRSAQAVYGFFHEPADEQRYPEYGNVQEGKHMTARSIYDSMIEIEPA